MLEDGSCSKQGSRELHGPAEDEDESMRGSCTGRDEREEGSCSKNERGMGVVERRWALNVERRMLRGGHSRTSNVERRRLDAELLRPNIEW